MQALLKQKIFLSDEPAPGQMDWSGNYNAFSLGKHSISRKSPVSRLYALNDDRLDAGKHIYLKILEDSDVILIPLSGAINYKDSLGNKGTIVQGQLLVLDMPAHTRIKVTNAAEHDVVNFLQLRIRTPEKTLYIHPQLSRFDLLHKNNKLIDVFSQQSATGCMAKLDKQTNIAYQLAHKRNHLFAFVIDGIFEMQYRLLQPRDGLVLWDIDEVGMEALSNNAVILLIEIPEE
jgi:redox-sensitive bicupin YhaK (pirin superfamily)